MNDIHILVLGQSNVANHGSGARQSNWGSCWCDGIRRRLADPLPGGTGEEGSVWTRLGPLLKGRGTISNFSVTVLARGGTSSADWAAGGKCYKRLLSAVPIVESSTEPVSHLLYHQGEKDTLLMTSSEAYFEQFLTLHEFISTTWPQLPFIVCTASHRDGVRSEAVRRAQNRIQTQLAGCQPGPDTDTLGSEFRRDDTHFNEAGLDAFARMLAATL